MAYTGHLRRRGRRRGNRARRARGCPWSGRSNRAGSAAGCRCTPPRSPPRPGAGIRRARARTPGHPLLHRARARCAARPPRSPAVPWASVRRHGLGRLTAGAQCGAIGVRELRHDAVVGWPPCRRVSAAPGHRIRDRPGLRCRRTVGCSCWVRSWRLPHFPGVGGGPPGLPLMARPGPAVEARCQAVGAVMVWSAASRRAKRSPGGDGLTLRDGGVSVREVMADDSAPKALLHGFSARAALSAMPFGRGFPRS